MAFLKLKVSPKVLQVYPPVGSTAGNIIQIAVAGLGLNQGGLKVVNTGNKVICKKVLSVSFGWVSCLTNTGAFSAADVEIEDTYGNTYKCLSDCSYSQTTAETPVISTITKPTTQF